MAQNFESALSTYLLRVNEKSSAEFKQNLPALFGTPLQPKYTASNGKKFVKIIREDAGQKSVFCFVDLTTGDLYKAAGWNAPAKGIRGNIYNDTYPLTLREFYRY